MKDAEITGVNIHALEINTRDNTLIVEIDWVTKEHGFGSIRLVANAGERDRLLVTKDVDLLRGGGVVRGGTSKNDAMKLIIESETLSPDFVKRVLCKLVDDAEKCG